MRSTIFPPTNQTLKKLCQGIISWKKLWVGGVRHLLVLANATLIDQLVSITQLAIPSQCNMNRFLVHKGVNGGCKESSIIHTRSWPPSFLTACRHTQLEFRYVWALLSSFFLQHFLLFLRKCRGGSIEVQVVVKARAHSAPLIPWNKVRRLPFKNWWRDK
jgi:hypothetical protein